MVALPSILVLSPLERPDPGVVAAAAGAGALGVLDLGHDAVALVHEVQAAHPALPVPDSLQERFALAAP